MREIFTLLGGLLLASSLTANAADVTVYLEDWDGNEIAKSYSAELTKDSEGVFTLSNFLNSDVPISFTFPELAPGEDSEMTITSPLYNTYFTDSNGYGLYCWLYGYNGIDDWTELDDPRYYKGADYTYVYRPAEDPDTYWAYICVKGTIVDDNGNESDSGWFQVIFEFNDNENSELILPDHLDYTLNGEKELPGVTVRQLIDETTQVFSVTGECDSDKITVTFEIPEGWDGMMISDTFGEGEISTVKTRSAELIPIDYILGQGFVEGNSITYATDGEAQWGMIALIKGDMACATFINYDLTVSNDGGSDVPGDEDPVIPEYIVVTPIGGNLDVTEESGAEYYNITVTGKAEENQVRVILDIPEGWDGFVSDAENVSEMGGFGPRSTRSGEIFWYPLEAMLEDGLKTGNDFSFDPTGEAHSVEIYLYKGENVAVSYPINLTVNVSANAPAPEFPESFEISYNGQPSLDLIEATQGEDEYGVYTIKISGITLENNVTVALGVPDGWDGFVSISDSELDPEISPLTRAYESEWIPVDVLLENGFKESNTLTFATDGEEHQGMFYLVKDGEADEANQIFVEFNVSNPTTVGVAGVEAIDANARYYDLSGRKIAKPAAGMYIKVLDGKASKVIIK